MERLVDGIGLLNNNVPDCPTLSPLREGKNPLPDPPVSPTLPPKIVKTCVPGLP